MAHGAPQRMRLAVDLPENLVQMPLPVEVRSHSLDTFPWGFGSEHRGNSKCSIATTRIPSDKAVRSVLAVSRRDRLVRGLEGPLRDVGQINCKGVSGREGANIQTFVLVRGCAAKTGELKELSCESLDLKEIMAEQPLKLHLQNHRLPSVSTAPVAIRIVRIALTGGRWAIRSIISRCITTNIGIIPCADNIGASMAGRQARPQYQP